MLIVLCHFNGDRLIHLITRHLSDECTNDLTQGREKQGWEERGEGQKQKEPTKEHMSERCVYIYRIGGRAIGSGWGRRPAAVAASKRSASFAHPTSFGDFVVLCFF